METNNQLSQEQSFVNPFLEQAKSEKQSNVFVDLLQSIVIAIALSLFLYVFIITPNEVEGSSMEPNFETGQLLFTSKMHAWLGGSGVGDSVGLEYKHGDVVVFQKPGLDDFVKRIIAVPGDTIAIENGKYILNGETIDEDFDIKNLERKDGEYLRDGGKAITLEDNEFFVSGDNRDVSFDSRSLGPIERKWIKGRVIFRFWPLGDFGYIGSGTFTEVE